MAKETYTPPQRFWKLLKPDAREIRNIYTYAVFSGLVSLSLPLGIQAIINLIQGGKVSSAWIVLVFFVVFGIAVNGLLQVYQLRISENLQQKIFTRAAFEFAHRIPRIKVSEMYSKYAPELMNRYFDVMNIQKGLSKILISISTAGIQVLFGLILLSLYHSFFILYSVFLVLLVYFIFKITARRGLKTSLIESKYKYELGHWLEEVARTANTFKLAGETDLNLTKSEKSVEKYIQAREDHFKVLVQQYSLLVLFKVVVAAGLLAVGGILVMEQVMNIGQFVAAEIIILMVISSVEKLIVSLDVVYDTLTSLEKVGQVTDLELENDDGMDIRSELDGGGMNIDMRKLNFKYPHGHKYVLKDIELSIKAGERLLVSGKNGSGKSTLLHVLAGLYELDEGSITYQGIPIKGIALSTLRSVIGTCLDREEIFQGTLTENITIGRPSANFSDVKWAIKNLGLEEFVKELPNGYETVIEPYGHTLSRSVIQKITIARAIVDRPRVLLFEYTFEHIDVEEKTKIIDFLVDKKHPWTIVASSKDKMLAERFDRVIIMDNGKITKNGTYEELKNDFE